MEYNDNQQKAEKIFSVSEFITLLNIGLNKSQVKMIGEVSEAKTNSSGHVYFVLKDKKDGSVMNCAIWKHRYAIYGIKLKEGMEIIVFGRPNIHKTYGFSFIAETVELAGEGALKKEYERLKKKLTEEGLFAKERKRPIPKYPKKVGIITSKQGAVLADFLNNLGRFGFKIKMIDSRVEGQAAINDLLNSIRTLKKEDIEVLVIMRGGGSLESMLAFNNESLVREIANFPVPVIVAIGHDKDVPFAALAADRSVSAPSIAAIVLLESWEQAISLLEEYERNVIGSYENVLENADFLINQSVDTIYGIKDLIFDKYKEIETALKISFQTFKNVLQNSKSNLKNSWSKSVFGFNSLLSMIKQQLEHSEKIIYLRNPETQLKLGYSIARCGDRLIKSIKDTKIGEDVDIRVVDGIIISEVKNINKINKKYAQRKTRY